MPRIQYFDRSGRELSRREALAADGRTMRDGVSMRVPFRDAAHRGTVGDARSFWDANRDSLLVVDARRIGGVEGNRPGYRVFDDDRGRQAIADARAEYIFDLENSWRNPPPRDALGSIPYTSAVEGSACTINGAAGRLVKVDGVLICRPIKELSTVSSFRVGTDARTVSCPDCDGGVDDDGDDCETCGGSGRVANGDNGETDRRTVGDVDAMSAAHQARMQRDFYDTYAREISEAWREGK
jgi:hypothetical protein